MLSRWAKEMVGRLLSLGCQRSDAEDVVQDTLLKALLYIEGIPPAAMRSWLFRVAINEFYSLCRRNARVSPMVLPPDSFDPRTTVEERLVREEELARVRSVLAGMPPRSRFLLEMRYTHGMSLVEIAAALGLKKSSVKVALHRARRLFSRLYGKTGE